MEKICDLTIYHFSIWALNFEKHFVGVAVVLLHPISKAFESLITKKENINIKKY